MGETLMEFNMTFTEVEVNLKGGLLNYRGHYPQWFMETPTTRATCSSLKVIESIDVFLLGVTSRAEIPGCVAFRMVKLSHHLTMLLLRDDMSSVPTNISLVLSKTFCAYISLINIYMIFICPRIKMQASIPHTRITKGQIWIQTPKSDTTEFPRVTPSKLELLLTAPWIFSGFYRITENSFRDRRVKSQLPV